MNYQIRVTKRVAKFLADHPEVRKQFWSKVELLAHNPWTEFLDIKTLKWVKDSFRLRIGKYRFLYSVLEEEYIIIMNDADSRGDVYKNT